MKGTVKWFSIRKGHGFITPDEGTRDVFVHYKAIEGEGYRSLSEGDRVNYELVQTEKGPQARKVRTINDTAGDLLDELPEPKYVDWRIG